MVGLISSKDDLETAVAGTRAQGTIANGSTGPATLYIVGSGGDLWTGNGSYYVAIVMYEGDVTSFIFISKAAISFNSASTTVAYSTSAFESADIGNGGNGGNVGENLPAATGANELSGKTCFGLYKGKIEFATTTETAKNGTYKKSKIDGDSVEGGGDPTFSEIENGTYSWDATSKKVVLKPAKISDGGVSMDAAGYKQFLQEWFDDYKTEHGEDAANELVPEGFSLSEYIDIKVKEEFANTTFAYDLVADGALLLSEELPSSVGANELKGKTFTNSRNTNETYIFSDTGYIYTYSDYSSDNATGTYAWDAQEKKVYLKPVKIDNKTNVHYFESLSGDINTRAGQTNSKFALTDYTYKLNDLTMDR
jgi:hypothetical protein